MRSPNTPEDREASEWLLALGSNRRSRHGSPRATLKVAADALGERVKVLAVSPVTDSAPLGPSRRRYANGALLVRTELSPPDLLAFTRSVERAFGRRRGRRWGERVLDIDLVLWSGGQWRSPGLTVPHPLFHERRFVLDPLAALAPGWRDPVGGLTIRQLAHRLTRPRPLPRSAGGGALSSVGRAADF